MKDSIRVLIDGEARGSWNMAVDEALFLSIKEGLSSPALRFYEWMPSCISLGYLQSANVIDRASCSDLKVDIVRRPTGGRAVLHENEITYSIVLPLPQGQGGSVRETCRIINQGVLSGLSRMGIICKFHRGAEKVKEGGFVPSPLCFTSFSQFELSFSERKILGSAQLRSQGVLLQHGSLPLYMDREKLHQVISAPSASRSSFQCPDSPIGLCELIGRGLDRRELITVFIEGFEESLKKGCAVGELTHEERERATLLEREKYVNDLWTFRR